MKRKTYPKTVVIIVSAILLAVSCSLAGPDRLLEVSIPRHPWETDGPNELWYTLRWSYGTEIRSAYIGPD